MPSAGNTSVKYAFTITLQPKLYRYKPEEQYDKTYMHIAKVLKALNSRVTLVAELTRSANIHYHGVIQFINFKPKSNLTVSFHNAFRGDKYAGFIKIIPIDNESKWIEYISKDVTDTTETIIRPSIILNEFNDLPNDNLLIQYDLIDEQ